MRKYLFILFLAGIALPVLSQITNSIPAKETVNHYTETTKVYGTTIDSRLLQSTKTTSINTHGVYPNLASTPLFNRLSTKETASGVNDWLKLIIPAMLAITVFFLGVLITWLKANMEHRKDTRHLRTTIITWIKYMSNEVNILASSCEDFAKRISETHEIHPEQLKFNFLYANKVSGIAVTQTIKAFVTNSKGDEDSKSKNYFKLISGLEYLAKIENEIKAKYDEHYSSTIKLLENWNKNFIEYDNSQINLITANVERDKERLTLEKELNEIAVKWLTENKEKGQNINYTNDELLIPFQNVISAYLQKTGSKEEDVSNLISTVQDLVIVYKQFSVSKEAYKMIFTEYAQKLSEVYKNTLMAAVYFEKSTSIKLLCN